MRARPIYVEIDIEAPFDDLWSATQTPELHARWDLRFSDIQYLPRPDPTEPQRFLYATRIGFGLAVAGEGESVGEHQGEDGTSTSALKFWSTDPKSLIREGSGYWKYIPTPAGVRFLTQYDYRTRFGAVGQWLDALAFRPVLGWATAWSFDRLRRWLESGETPEASLRRAAVHAIARLTLAAIWLYQGLVPKLLVRDSGELAILRASGVLPGREPVLLTAIGLAEILFGIVMLSLPTARWPFVANLVVLPLLALGAAASQPAIFAAPFNPATLTVAMMALATIALLVGSDLPSARRCLRKPRA